MQDNHPIVILHSVMIKRQLTRELRATAGEYPVFSVTGPRQSGKTTLMRHIFPDYDYVNLEYPDVRERAASDPRDFLRMHGDRVIFDEIQRVPDLLSYIQPMVDEDDSPGRFGLTGSQNFLLNQSVSQSLAGRCGVMHLLPFALSELNNRPPLNILEMNTGHDSDTRDIDILDLLVKGFYPRIHDKKLSPGRWYANYFQTYLERDVSQLTNVGDIETFAKFVRLCAGRSGQLLNMASLADDCGVAHSTVRRWISVLQAGFIVLLLRPYYKNFNKRLRKSPKLYFLDTGLLCYLLNIRSSDELSIHNMRGAIFESFVISELYKQVQNRMLDADLYFWRDSNGREVDVLIETGTHVLPVEIKSAMTLNNSFFDIFDYWRELISKPKAPGILVYGGTESLTQKGVQIVPAEVL